jgi:GT2 family glycosyltransferase
MLSIIIVNYKSEKYLAKCISSIKEKFLGVEYEVIVVNNDNVDISFLGGDKIINTGKNIGFGAACNVGAKNAQGEILWFLNPDTEIISQNVTELVKELNKEGVGIIGPRLVDKKNKTQEWIAGKKITIFGTLLNNLGYKRDKKIWESITLVGCDWVSGAAMFVKKDIFEKVGGFDENFFMYFEDINLCQRIRQAGYKIFYFPSCIVKHFSGGSFGGKIRQKGYYYKAQFRYFFKSILL